MYVTCLYAFGLFPDLFHLPACLKLLYDFWQAVDETPQANLECHNRDIVKPYKATALRKSCFGHFTSAQNIHPRHFLEVITKMPIVKTQLVLTTLDLVFSVTAHIGLCSILVSQGIPAGHSSVQYASTSVSDILQYSTYTS